MKKIFNRKPIMVLVASIYVLAQSVFAIPVHAATEPNLIPNPGFEQVDGSNSSVPADWQTNSWGTNTASFSYLNSGHSGNHSVQTTISKYQSGDGKWMFSPVSVTSGSQYSYSDWYQSTATTNLWAQEITSSGQTQYQWLAAENASATWTQANTNITVPANVTSMDIFHVLNANGSLSIDDVSLSLVPVCNVSESNGIYNGGFEQTCPSNPNLPADWSTETTSNTQATFTYSNMAHSGAYSAEISYASGNGEAGWQSNFQPAASNQRYSLTFWLNGTTYSYAYVTIEHTDGSLSYVSLTSVPQTEGPWSQYYDAFVTPSDTQAIQITLATSGPGNVFFDDVYLNTLANQTPVNFNKGVVSLSFDDGDASTYQSGLPILSAYRLPATFYINGGTLGTSGYMTTSDVANLAKDNEEVGSHLYYHDDMESLTQSQLVELLSENLSDLSSIVGPNYKVTDFASPYSSFTSGIIDTVMQYYQSHRDTSGATNDKANLNVRQLHGTLVLKATTMSGFETEVQNAIKNDDWLILVYHGIGSAPANSEGDIPYTVSVSNFAQQMEYLAKIGVTVLPVNQALTTLQAQE